MAFLQRPSVGKEGGGIPGGFSDSNTLEYLPEVLWANASFNRYRSQILGGMTKLLIHKNMCLIQLENPHVLEIWFNSLVNVERMRFRTVPKSISEVRYGQAV